MESFRNSFLTIERGYHDHYKVRNRRQILIADRDVQSAKTLKEFLVVKGYYVTVVNRWRYLLLEMKRINISLLFLDITLLDVQGYRLIPIIKRIQPDTYIVITTGSNSKEIEYQVRDYDILFYCLKPYDMREINLLLANKILFLWQGRKGAKN